MIPPVNQSSEDFKINNYAYVSSLFKNRQTFLIETPSLFKINIQISIKPEKNF